MFEICWMGRFNYARLAVEETILKAVKRLQEFKKMEDYKSYQLFIKHNNKIVASQEDAGPLQWCNLGMKTAYEMQSSLQREEPCEEKGIVDNWYTVNTIGKWPQEHGCTASLNVAVELMLETSKKPQYRGKLQLVIRKNDQLVCSLDNCDRLVWISKHEKINYNNQCQKLGVSPRLDDRKEPKEEPKEDIFAKMNQLLSTARKVIVNPIQEHQDVGFRIKVQKPDGYYNHLHVWYEYNCERILAKVE